MQYQQYIQIAPDIMMGKAVVKGTRITVELILDKLAAGESIQDILIAHPHLSQEAVYAALSYAAVVLETSSNKLLFAEGLVFIDQTHIVEALFAIERMQDTDPQPMESVNTVASLVKTPTENLVIPEHQFSAIMKDFKDIRESLENRQKRDGNYVPHPKQVQEAKEELQQLEAVEAWYEEAEDFCRHVFSWWTIPNWLGNLLIEKGEAVVRGYNCSWWGITDMTIAYPGTAAVLKEICAELSAVPNYEPDRVIYGKYRLYYPDKERYRRIITGTYK